VRCDVGIAEYSCMHTPHMQHTAGDNKPTQQHKALLLLCFCTASFSPLSGSCEPLMATKCSLLLLLLLLLGLATTVGRGELNAPTAVLLPLLVNSRMYSMHLQTQQQRYTAQHTSKCCCAFVCCVCAWLRCYLFHCVKTCMHVCSCTVATQPSKTLQLFWVCFQAHCWATAAPAATQHVVSAYSTAQPLQFAGTTVLSFQLTPWPCTPLL
jgi:hypothetical protein